MIREIKYRVYDKKEKCYSDKAFSIDQLGICYVQDEDGYWEEIDDERYIVEQYIGLEDRNGKEIYKGDIVEDTLDGLKYVVRWIEYEARFIGVRKSLPNWYPNDTSWVHIEVVGNIHENPKLLGGEK